MLSINWWLALLAFAVLPLILIVTRIFRDRCGELPAGAGGDCAHQQLYAGAHQRHGVVQLFNREERAFKDLKR